MRVNDRHRANKTSSRGECRSDNAGQRNGIHFKLHQAKQCAARFGNRNGDRILGNKIRACVAGRASVYDRGGHRPLPSGRSKFSRRKFDGPRDMLFGRRGHVQL